MTSDALQVQQIDRPSGQGTRYSDRLEHRVRHAAGPIDLATAFSSAVEAQIAYEWFSRIHRVLKTDPFQSHIAPNTLYVPFGRQMGGSGDAPALIEAERNLYKKALGELKTQQEGSKHDRPGQPGTLEIDEAMALAHPIALRLLAWLYVEQELRLPQVFDAFGGSSTVFEGVARLHFLGAVRFEDDCLRLMQYGRRILLAFGILDDEEQPQT